MLRDHFVHKIGHFIGFKEALCMEIMLVYMYFMIVDVLTEVIKKLNFTIHDCVKSHINEFFFLVLKYVILRIQHRLQTTMLYLYFKV